MGILADVFRLSFNKNACVFILPDYQRFLLRFVVQQVKQFFVVYLQKRAVNEERRLFVFSESVRSCMPCHDFDLFKNLVNRSGDYSYVSFVVKLFSTIVTPHRVLMAVWVVVPMWTEHRECFS